MELLGADDAAVMLSAAHPELSDEVPRRVLANARGNPLALEELPRAFGGRADGLLPGGTETLPLLRALESHLNVIAGYLRGFLGKVLS